MSVFKSNCKWICGKANSLPLLYHWHWWECHKYNFCCDKSFVTNMCFLQQTCFCRDKSVLVTSFVTKNFHNKNSCYKSCHDKYLLRPTWFCHNKMFVMTNILLLQQTHVCHDKICCDKHKFVATNICCDKCFVATNIILSWHFLLLQQAYFCRNKRRVLSWHMFVVTKLLLQQKWWQLPPMILFLTLSATSLLHAHVHIHA